MTPSEDARSDFDSLECRAGYENWAAIQVQLAAWASTIREHRNPRDIENVLGVMEEVGELCQAILHHSQGRHGMTEERMREEVGDAIADISIFLIQLATCYRFDYQTLVTDTAEVVMKRDWAKYPETGHAPVETEADHRIDALVARQPRRRAARPAK